MLVVCTNWEPQRQRFSRNITNGTAVLDMSMVESYDISMRYQTCPMPFQPSPQLNTNVTLAVQQKPRRTGIMSLQSMQRHPWILFPPTFVEPFLYQSIGKRPISLRLLTITLDVALSSLDQRVKMWLSSYSNGRRLLSYKSREGSRQSGSTMQGN